MKIAIIVSVFPKLSETFILSHITGLLDLGFDVEIFANYKPKEEKTHPVVKKYLLLERTHYFEMPKNKVLRILKAIFLITVIFYKDPRKIVSALKQTMLKNRRTSCLLPFYLLIPFLNKNFDVIHCHFGPNGIHGSLLKKMGVRGKYITTFHGYDMSSIILNNGEMIYKDLFNDGDLFLPISDYWGKKLIDLGCDENKIIVHRMGINLQNLKFLERKKQPEKPIRILTVGRLVEKKGHKYSIQAISKVIKKCRNIEYVIAGGGPLRKELENLVSELRIEDYVKFLGPVNQDEVLNLYDQAHIFLLPSMTASDGDKEGIPVALMEAQAMGLPVISTLHSGIPELVIDGKSGFLVPEKDVDTLVKKIEYLIEHPEIWPKFGSYGRKFVEEKYNIRKLNQRLLEIYSNLIKEAFTQEQ